MVSPFIFQILSRNYFESFLMKDMTFFCRCNYIFWAINFYPTTTKHRTSEIETCYIEVILKLSVQLAALLHTRIALIVSPNCIINCFKYLSSASSYLIPGSDIHSGSSRLLFAVPPEYQRDKDQRTLVLNSLSWWRTVNNPAIANFIWSYHKESIMKVFIANILAI